jgi:hypothetical protein
MTTRWSGGSFTRTASLSGNAVYRPRGSTSLTRLLSSGPQPSVRAEVPLAARHVCKSGQCRGVSVDVALQEKISHFTDWAAYLRSLNYSGPKVHPAPETGKPTLVFELGPRGPGAHDNVCGWSNAWLHRGRAPRSGNGPVERVTSQKKARSLSMGGTEGGGAGGIFRVIRDIEILFPLAGWQVVNRAFAGSAPRGDWPVSIEVPDGAKRPDGVPPGLFPPSRDSRIEGGHVREEVEVDKIEEAESAGLGGKDRRKAETANLVVEKLGDHFLIVGQVRRDAKNFISLLLVSLAALGTVRVTGIRFRNTEAAGVLKE